MVTAPAASRIQSAEAKKGGTGGVSKGGFAARAQSAAERNARALGKRIGRGGRKFGKSRWPLVIGIAVVGALVWRRYGSKSDNHVVSEKINDAVSVSSKALNDLVDDVKQNPSVSSVTNAAKEYGNVLMDGMQKNETLVKASNTAWDLTNSMSSFVQEKMNSVVESVLSWMPKDRQ